MSTTRPILTSSDFTLMKCSMFMVLVITLIFVHLSTAVAGESGGPVVESYRTEDLAYLDQGKTIPWADDAVVAAFVAHLMSYPKMQYDVPQVPR